MENTKKMILIEPEVIERLKSRDTAHEDSLSRLDKEMQNILKSKKDDREKWSLYMQILQRYLHFAGEERRPLRLPIMMENEEKHEGTVFKKESERNDSSVNEDFEDDQHVHGFSIDMIYTPTYIKKLIPKSYRKKAEILLDILLNNKDKISWKNDGSLVIDNDIIENSNIVDLVNYSLRSLKRSKPNGWDKFMETLKVIRAPSSCIGNPEAIEHISNISPNTRRQSSPIIIKSPKISSSDKLKNKNDVWERWNPY